MTDHTDAKCWLCGKSDKFLVYEEESDTYVHVDCIRMALKEDEKTAETATKVKRMSYLLGDGI